MSTPGGRRAPDSFHEMNPTARFTDRAGDYSRYRPSYPPSAIDAILGALAEVCDPVGPLVAADIGAGTGISSRLLADRGVSVIAIEPNAGMREAAAPHSLVEWRDATAERTGLPDQSVDIVLCAQSFHWFEPRPTLAEFHRILRRPGRLALLWNDRDTSDPTTVAYTRLIEAVSANHPAVNRPDPRGVIAADRHFRAAGQLEFDYAQELNRRGLIGRALSASYAPKEGEAHDMLISGLEEIYHDHANPAGIVKLRYRTRLYLAETQ